MDIAVRDFEKGERDLTLDEINRRRDALLGRRGSTFKKRDGTCVVAVLVDDNWHLEPIERAETVLGSGASFAEAFAKAERAVKNGRVGHLDLS